jgi:hypothetical protein
MHDTLQLTGPARRTGRRRWSIWLVAGAVFVLAFTLEFLEHELPNEHFLFISGARQMLAYGELPVRDFIETGQYPMYYLSAAALALSGGTLLGEVILSASFMAAAAMLTFLLAQWAARSVVLGLAATLFLLMLDPRLYNYYKLFLLALGILLCWLYIDRRTVGRLMALALGTALAAIARGDLGLDVGVGAIVALVASHWRDGFRVLLQRTAIFGATLAAALAPFLVVLQLSGGVGEYYRVVLAFGRAEKDLLSFERPAFSVDPSVPLVEVDPSSSRRIGIEWAKTVSPVLRAELERAYGLAKGSPDPDRADERSWTYELSDLSTSNVAAIEKDGRIKDTERLEQVVREAAHEQLIPRISVLPGIVRRENAEVWLYYLMYALPGMAILAASAGTLRSGPRAQRMRREAPKIVSAAALSVVALHVLVTDASHARLSDAGGLAAVLGAWLLGQMIGRGGLAPGRYQRPWLARAWTRGAGPLLRWGVALGVFTISLVSAAVAADAGPMLDKTAWPVLAEPEVLVERGEEAIDELTASPPIDEWAGPRENGLPALARYLHECTRPTDRILVTFFEPGLAFYAERAFAGGAPFFHLDHFSDPETQRQILDRLREQSVPIVVARADHYEEWFEPNLTLVDGHIQSHYRVALDSRFGEDEGRAYRVFVDRQREPSGTDERWGLPCFS